VRIVVDTAVFSASLSRRRRARFETQIGLMAGHQIFLAAVRCSTAVLLVKSESGCTQEDVVTGDKWRVGVERRGCDPQVVGVDLIIQWVPRSTTGEGELGEGREKPIADGDDRGCLDRLLEAVAARHGPSGHEGAVSELATWRQRLWRSRAAPSGQTVSSAGDLVSAGSPLADGRGIVSSPATPAKGGVPCLQLRACRRYQDRGPHDRRQADRMSVPSTPPMSSRPA